MEKAHASITFKMRKRKRMTDDKKPRPATPDTVHVEFLRDYWEDCPDAEDGTGTRRVPAGTVKVVPTMDAFAMMEKGLAKKV